MFVFCSDVFFFQAEDGIRDLVRSRGLGDVYKRQAIPRDQIGHGILARAFGHEPGVFDDLGAAVPQLLSLIHI